MPNSIWPINLIIALLIVMLFVPAHAIKCYVCQSNVDPKCADPFDNSTIAITDCGEYPRADLVTRSELDIIEERGFFSAFSQPAPVRPVVANKCRKIRQKVDGEWRTIRGCGYLGPPGNVTPDKQGSDIGQCEMRHGSYDVFMESCTCNNKDGCNGSDSNTKILTNTFCLLMATISFHVLIKF